MMLMAGDAMLSTLGCAFLLMSSANHVGKSMIRNGKIYLEINECILAVNPSGAEIADSLHHSGKTLILPVLIDRGVKSGHEVFVGGFNQGGRLLRLKSRGVMFSLLLSA